MSASVSVSFAVGGVASDSDPSALASTLREVATWLEGFDDMGLSVVDLDGFAADAEVSDDSLGVRVSIGRVV